MNVSAAPESASIIAPKAQSVRLSPPAVVYTFSFPHHGLYSSFHRLAHYLSDQCVIDMSWQRLDRFPRWIAGKLRKRWFKYGEYRLIWHLRLTTPRCVHYLYPENSLRLSWRWKGRHKLVLTVHQPREFLERMRQRRGYKRFFLGLRMADAVIAMDPESLEAYRAYAPQARLEIIPHGVDTEFFQPTPDFFRCPVILTMGNWLRDYECWANVVRRLSVRLPAVEYEVIANPDTLRHARAALGTDTFPVRFSAGLSDLELRTAYERALLMFLPLKASAANNAVLESLAMGLPLVVTDLPATRFYVGAEAGKFIHNTDIEGCVDMLANLVNDAAQRQRMAAAGRARAVAEYSWPRIADRYRALYQSLLKGQD
jgi:glycosyltransferase involved in cell wall biosynthesis